MPDYLTVAEAAGALSNSRATLAEAWHILRDNHDAHGVMPPQTEQAQWNALVHRQIGAELDLLAFVAQTDPDATFTLPDGRPVNYSDALDYAQRHQVIGDYAGVPDDTSAFGEPVTLIVVGIVIVVTALVAAAVFYHHDSTELESIQAQAEQGRQYAASVQACLAHNSAEACARTVSPVPFQPPSHHDDNGLPGWAKGVIAVGAVAVVGAVAWVVIPRYKRREALSPTWRPSMAGGALAYPERVHRQLTWGALRNADTGLVEALRHARAGDCRAALRWYEAGVESLATATSEARAGHGWEDPPGMHASRRLARVARRALVGRCLRGVG